MLRQLLLLASCVVLMGCRGVSSTDRMAATPDSVGHIARNARRQAQEADPPKKKKKKPKPEKPEPKPEDTKRTFTEPIDPQSLFTEATDDERVSGTGEFHPRALPEPDVSVSTHPAPIIPLP